MSHDSNLSLVEFEDAPAMVDVDIFPVPPETKFLDDDGNARMFLEAPELDNVVHRHINTYEEFAELTNVKITCLWKQKGGIRGGKATLGACRRVTGMLTHFARSNFVIWLAAEQLRHKATTRDIEGCLYHELCHIEYDPQDGKFGLRGHDFEGFASELRRFGVWRGDLEIAGKAFRQLQLFKEEE
jgi:hypothetical protein